jgi:hypothetical protein
MLGSASTLPPFIPATARMADRIWFKEHPARKMRLRPPIDDEYETEFRGFGMHAKDRRRIIVFRISTGAGRRHNVDFARVAFLLFADETVEDTDEIIGPILGQLMREASER